MIAVQAGPALSAYRGDDDEPWRIDRLREVARLIGALPIISLHDHKGTLSVDWARPPTTLELLHVAKCWHCEKEWWAIHYVEGELFFDDNGPLDTARSMCE